MNILFVLLLAGTARFVNAALLRRSLAVAVTNNGEAFVGADTILCRITLTTSMFEESGPHDIRHEENYGCIPILNNTESDNVYSINIPFSIVTQPHYLNEIERGLLLLKVHGAVLREHEVKTFGTTKYEVLQQDNNPFHRRLELKTKGSLSLMVVRVTTSDGVGPTFSLDQIRSRIFGHKTGMAAQYKACSFGQLTFSDAGGLEVNLPWPVSFYNSETQLLRDAQKAVLDTYGVKAGDLADKVMFCQPPGAGGGWLASAIVNHWVSHYSNEWCVSLSATMHEMGHSLGVLHSGRGDDEYGDSTGYMGGGNIRQDFPHKCFNGLKNHLFGWYQTREVFVDPLSPHLIELAAFTDFDKTEKDQPVLLNVGDKYFLQYNRANRFNEETGDEADAVTITEDKGPWSSRITGLFVNDQWVASGFDGSQRNLVVKVCDKLDASKNNGVDAMIVSIAFDIDLCSYQTGQPQTADQPLTNISSPPAIDFTPESFFQAPILGAMPSCQNEMLLCTGNHDCCGNLVCLGESEQKCQKCRNAGQECLRNEECCEDSRCNYRGYCEKRFISPPLQLP